MHLEVTYVYCDVIITEQLRLYKSLMTQNISYPFVSFSAIDTCDMLTAAIIVYGNCTTMYSFCFLLFYMIYIISLHIVFMNYVIGLCFFRHYIDGMILHCSAFF